MLHGIELNGDGHAAWFHFGLLRMVQSLSPFRVQSDNVLPWAKRWNTRSFLHSVKKLQDTIWKFDRAAGHVDTCRRAVQAWVEREALGEISRVNITDPDFGGYLAALEDLPLFLDSMLLYLRIESDAFAALVPYFYENIGSIPSRSFREQRQWFLSKRSRFDREYAAILSDCSKWFDDLAGKNPSGLRDVIVHRAGTYQLGWTLPSEKDAFELRASLVNAQGFVEDDVLGALVGITKGWFEFLDQCFVHFRVRLQPVVSWADLARDELSRYVDCGGTELPSFWVYPRAA